jgi:hypothetical protein
VKRARDRLAEPPRGAGDERARALERQSHAGLTL